MKQRQTTIWIKVHSDIFHVFLPGLNTTGQNYSDWNQIWKQSLIWGFDEAVHWALDLHCCLILSSFA